MRTSFLIGLGLLVSLGGSARPQAKFNEISKARTILHQAARVAESIPNDPAKPADVLRVSYLDPLYEAEKRENALMAIAQAETKAGDFEAANQIAGALGKGEARNSINNSIAIARAKTGNPETDLKAIVSLPEERKQFLLYQFGLARAHGGDAAGAIQFARGITNEAAKGHLLAEIVSAQAKAGDVPGALKTADAIGAINANSAQKIQALLAVAGAQEKSGDRAGAGNTLHQARALISADSSLRNDRSTLGKIARAQAEAGQFKEALETAQSIPFDVPRNVVLATIAGLQGQAGDVQGSFQTLQAIQGTDNEYWKAMALARIGRAQASPGDAAAAAAIFQNAIRTVESMKDSNQTVRDPQGNASTYVQSVAFPRGLRLVDIAKAQAQAGEKAESVATLDKALSTARAMPDPPAGAVNYEAYGKDMLLSLIARAQAQAGFVKDALKTAGEIRVLPGKSRERGWKGGDPNVETLFEIARAQGSRAEPHEAVAWIETLKTPSQKTYALLGLAKGLLERAGAESEEPLPGEI